MAGPAFKFPPFHGFPPSFTVQPAAATRAKQTQLWCDLIRSYCRFHRIFWLDTASDAAAALFSNDSIGRSLADDDICFFLGELVLRGDAEWAPDRTRCLVYWRRPAEWAQLIFKWVEDTGQNGQVVTVHEIRNGSSSQGQQFYGLEMDTTMRALQALEADGKCAIMEGEVNDGLGVKFAF